MAVAADNAARELAGSGDRSVVGTEPSTGLWTRRYHPRGMGSDWRAPQWWQSALSLTTLIRYLQVTHDTQPAYQQLIARADQLNISLPGTLEPTTSPTSSWMTPRSGGSHGWTPPVMS